MPVVNLKELPGVGRGRRFGVMLFYQNLSQGFDMYGEHGFNAILGSINTKTFLPCCDLVTARYASELVGQTTVWGRGFDDSPGTQYDRSRTNETSRALMDPAEIRQFPVHRQAITIVETMPPVKWTYPKSAKTGPRVIPRRYGMPRIINFTEAENMTSERRLREAAAARLALTSSDEAARSDDDVQEGVDSADAAPKKANVKVRVQKKAAAIEEHVKEQTDESLTKSKPVPEEVIKERTHESIGHLLSLFDSPATTPPASDPASSLEKILNP